MGDCIQRLSPVPGKNTVVVHAGGSRFEIAGTAAAELGLVPGLEITERMRQALVAAASRREAAARVLRWLRGRPRTERDVRRYLETRGFVAEVGESVVAELRKQGLVDDARFAQWFVEAQLSRRPVALAVLEAALAAQGVPEPEAEVALAAWRGRSDEKELALAAARQRLPACRGLPPAKAAARLGRYLAARGFGLETVGEVCRALLGQEPGEDDAGSGRSRFG
ncbi:MAG TPA: regulatory protein RecX [Candidatus Krumholzibacteria bacterium]|nr:regulatory protein RecX [Candidatus Krumholzibacteria bacterium]